MKVKETISMTDVLALSLAERIQLVEDIWDSIASVPDAVELTDWQKEELDRRLEALRKDPEAGSSLEELISEIRQSE
ncbi:MAG: addiction module protein [Phycisphaerae bacterium]|nr:addiction module protein [Phycisphaerae bacterium]